MGYSAQIDPNAQAAAKEAAESGGSRDGFPPLSAGKYQANVVKVVGVEPFTKNQASDNYGKNALKVQLQIVDNSPTGAKRTFFDRIPLFTRYAPNQKSPQGAAARGYWDFFGKAIGVSQEDLIAGRLPGDEGIQGKQVTITLGAPIAPDQYNPKGSNEVSYYDKAGDVNSSPTFLARVAWLDADGNLVDGFAPAVPGAQTSFPAAGTASQATPGSADLWGTPTPAAPAAGTAPAAAQQNLWNPADDVQPAAEQAASNAQQQKGF